MVRTTPPDQYNNATPGLEPEIKEGGGYRNRWTSIFDEYPMSLPVDWKCPCGATLRGNRTCLKCGRAPMDQNVAMKPEAIRGRQWRRFAKAAGRRL